MSEAVARLVVREGVVEPGQEGRSLGGGRRLG